MNIKYSQLKELFDWSKSQKEEDKVQKAINKDTDTDTEINPKLPNQGDGNINKETGIENIREEEKEDESKTAKDKQEKVFFLTEKIIEDWKKKLPIQPLFDTLIHLRDSLTDSTETNIQNVGSIYIYIYIYI